jgi:metallo-beta-lactamase class B
MRLPAILALLLVAAAAPPAQNTDWSAAIKEWTAPMEPFRIAGNVYYVGTGGIAAYLVTGAHGHILIDGGLPQSAGVIADHIRQLGFKLEDVHVLLINHAHFDHSGGLAELKRLTGAELLASAGDKPDLEAGRTAGRPDLLDFPPVKVDELVEDGEIMHLGGVQMVAHLTPGHTPGCTSWTTDVREGGRTLKLLFACSLTVAGRDLRGSAEGEFRTTFAKLKGMQADIFVNFHPAAFGMEAKRAKLLAGDRFAFVDPGELARRVVAAEAGFEKELAAQRAGAH